MEKIETSIELTKDLYLQISADKASQISALKQEKDDTTEKIHGQIEYLKELNAALRKLQDKIAETENGLRESKKRKWVLKRELSLQNKFAKRLNRAFTRGDETIDLKKYYTAAEQKIR